MSTTTHSAVVVHDDSAITGQFVIFSGDTESKLPRRQKLAGQWQIALGDEIGLVEVTNHGRPIGWLLGVVADLAEGVVITDRLALEVPHSSAAEWKAICERCAGSWLFVAVDGEELEFRPDSCATVGLVYDPAQRQAAAYAYLLVGDAYQVRLMESERKLNAVEGDGWFTGGMTAHAGISRLLPNHCVNTRDWTMRRLSLELPDYTSEVATTIDAIAAEIATVTAAALAHRPSKVCLTGGNETRALLAALRAQVTELEFLTMGFEASTLDVHLSRRLAADFGLDHTVLPQKRAGPDEQAVWLLGAGHAMAGNNKDFFPSMEPLAGQYLIGGLGGEVGRGFLWPADLAGTDRISVEYVLARLKQPATPANVEAVSAWHAQVPQGLDAFQMLDLAYLELRMGPWAFAQPRMRVVPRAIHPLISYNQFARMWSLPPQIRQADTMIHLLVERSWPELLHIPINRYGDWRDGWSRVSKAAKRPDKLVRKLRQLAKSRR